MCESATGKLKSMTSLYLEKGDKLLLLYRIGSREVKESYIGTAGGHFEKEELNDAKACVLRELYEETGLCSADIEGLSLRYVTLRLRAGEIRQIYYFFAALKEDSRDIESNEGRLQWIDKGDALKYEMPFTAKYVVQHYLETGRKTNALYGGIAVEEGVVFTELKEFL